MTPETSGMIVPPQKTQTDEAKEKLLATLSAEELSNSSCRISERLGRRFSAGMEYESKEALNATVDEVGKVFPEAADAYKPSGRTTALAVILMVAAAPLSWRSWPGFAADYAGEKSCWEQSLNYRLQLWGNSTSSWT